MFVFLAISRKVHYIQNWHNAQWCQFPFRLIYYCGSNKSTGKESGKTHLCALVKDLSQSHQAANATIVIAL
jgi:hypothetical protein